MNTHQTILVAEDDTVLRNILLDGLSAQGYRAIGAENGKIALELLKRERPDLLLLDILMPEKYGMEVLEELRADETIKNTPVIIISNSGQPVEIERAKELGVLDFLVKTTFDSNDVLEKVKQVFIDHVSDGLPINKRNASKQPHNAMKILVIEDDKFLRELLIGKLISEGYAIESAVDGKEALAAIEHEAPDLVLLDLILPDVSGFEVLEKMRTKKDWVSVPIIVLSNLDQKEDIEKATTLGADDFMIKANFSLNEIIARIKKVRAGA